MLYRHRRLATCLLAMAMAASTIGVARPATHHVRTATELARAAHGHARRCDIAAPHHYSPRQIECMILVIWPAGLEHEAVSVARCESNLVANPPPNPASTADGVFQFLDGTWATTPQFRAVFDKARRAGAAYGHAIDVAYNAVRDPVLNIRAALWLYLTGGHWRQWVCKPT